MSSIERLTKQIATARSLLRERETDASADFMSRLGAENLRAHVDDLQAQLRTAKKARAVEILEVRLLGRVAKAGTIPLYLLSELASKLADSIHATSQKLKSGKRVRRISPTVVDQLDLRLADLAPGSTRLFISGNIEPDLFGESLLETSLESLFELFEASDEDALARMVSTVGIRSARGIREFLTTLKGAELDVEFSWRTGENRIHSWHGDYQAISRMSRRLGAFKMIEPSYITVRGSVVALSARGKFEIDADGKLYAGSFPADLLSQVVNLHIGEEVSATIEQTVIINTVTHVEKASYTLVAIASTGQTTFGEP